MRAVGSVGVVGPGPRWTLATTSSLDGEGGHDDGVATLDAVAAAITAAITASGVSRASVRAATVADAAAIAAVQLVVWRGPYAEFLPPAVVAGLDDAAVQEAWVQAVGAEGDAHVLVALEGAVVTGFAAGSGAEIATLLVDPRWGRRGHGGRLLGTLAARLHDGGAQRGQVWVAEHDEASQRFFPRHGWHPDGTVRTSSHGAQVLRERRLTGSTELAWR